MKLKDSSENDLNELENELLIEARKLDQTELRKLVAQARALADFEERES
jgi:hypothetical protein